MLTWCISSLLEVLYHVYAALPPTPDSPGMYTPTLSTASFMLVFVLCQDDPRQVKHTWLTVRHQSNLIKKQVHGLVQQVAEEWTELEVIGSVCGCNLCSAASWDWLMSSCLCLKFPPVQSTASVCVTLRREISQRQWRPWCALRLRFATSDVWIDKDFWLGSVDLYKACPYLPVDHNTWPASRNTQQSSTLLLLSLRRWGSVTPTAWILSTFRQWTPLTNGPPFPLFQSVKSRAECIFVRYLASNVFPACAKFSWLRQTPNSVPWGRRESCPLWFVLCSDL